MGLPLEGMRVLDLTRALSGPFCTMILADLGAEVVKIEPCPNGDMIREWGPFDHGVSAYYLSSNRNKKSLAVDFRKTGGLDLIKELAIKSDVITENFRPGRMDEMGLGHTTLALENPELIYASITGFGRTGPAGNWPGFDQIAQGYSGIMSVTGTAEAGPTRMGIAISDLTSGMWTAMGILAAWIEKSKTGKGQRVENSLLASMVGLLSVQGQRYLSTGHIPEPTGNTHPVISPYGVFYAADGPMNIAAATQSMWLKLCDLLNLTALTEDPRFKANADRMENREELKTIIDRELARKRRAEWMPDMIAIGIPAGPINNMEEVFNDAQVKHCRMVETINHPIVGELKQLGLPILMESLENGSVRTPPPMFGEHTREVLSSYGFDDPTIEGFFDSEFIFQHDNL